MVKKSEDRIQLSIEIVDPRLLDAIRKSDCFPNKDTMFDNISHHYGRSSQFSEILEKIEENFTQYLRDHYDISIQEKVDEQQLEIDRAVHLVTRSLTKIMSKHDISIQEEV